MANESGFDKEFDRIMSASGLGDAFDGILGSPFGDRIRPPQRPAGRTDKPLPQIRGKQIDGVMYLRAEDVADAMEAGAPKACARLIAKFRAYANRTP